MAREELHQRTVDALNIPTPTMSDKKKAGKKGIERCRNRALGARRGVLAPSSSHRHAIEEMSRRWRRDERPCGLGRAAGDHRPEGP